MAAPAVLRLGPVGERRLLHDVSATAVPERWQARRSPNICVRQLHRLSGCLRTDPSVMAGEWAVGGTGRFSFGWLPAPRGRGY